MRNIALIRKSLVLLASLIALSVLGGPSTTFAADTSVTPTPSLIFFAQGTWTDSGATLAADVDASPSTTSILISDKNFLREGWTVKVDNESMLIEQLIDGGYGKPTPPDTMVVQRGVNGSAPGFHPSGRPIKAHTVSVSIYANNVTDYWGLGGFQVGITLPPGLELIKMTSEPAWLASTGRDPWCFGPYNTPGTSNWQVSCSTLGNPEDGRYPIGPKGSGLIAKVILLPSEDSGLRTVSLAGQLVNTPAQAIPATSQDFKIRVLECPDANLDGIINVLDLLIIAKNNGDQGEDSGAALESQVDASQTNMLVSDQSLLLPILPYNTISIDTEQMTLQALQEGTPDIMTVARAINSPAKPHNAGAHIYRGTFDGNYDGKYGYTWPRDANRDGIINVNDLLLVAKISGMECPAP